MPNIEEKELVVLVDRPVRTEDGKAAPARASFWKEVLETDTFVEISIAHEKERKGEVRIDRHKYVIINWDAANGDYACGSDDVFLYFTTREDRRDALMNDGGRLLCEFQSGRGSLHQGAYDAIFGRDEVQVEKNSLPSQSRGERLQKVAWDGWNNTKASVFQFMFSGRHPITRGLPKIVETCHKGSLKPIFNFRTLQQQEHSYWYLNQKSVFNGWFRNWRKGWIPLLVAVQRNPLPWRNQLFRPQQSVLLAKCEGSGILLASTMWIAGSNLRELVNKILRTPGSEIVAFHKRIRRLRCVNDILSFIPFAVFFYFLLHVFSAIMHGKRSETMTGTILGETGFVWIGILLIQLWWHIVWKRPFGVTPLQYFVSGFQSWWDSI